MQRNVSTDGDFLERAHSEFILSQLPNYNAMWSAFFGNDGSNRILRVREEDSVTAARRNLAEQHYSCLESILCIKQLRDKYAAQTATEEVEASVYLQSLNDFMAFHAHVGRIRDLLDRMKNSLGVKDLTNPFERDYDTRCVVVHGKKSPFSIIFGEIAFPEIADESNAQKHQWSGEQNWGSVDPSKFKMLSEILDEALPLLTSKLNAFLGQLYGAAKAHFGELRVTFPENRFMLKGEQPSSFMANSPVSPSGVEPMPSIRPSGYDSV